MELWIATSNKGKLKEFQQIFSTLPLAVRGQNELPVFSAPPETGKTFAENALIKAKALRSIKDSDWVLADDSGLIVEGLGGLPGIYSARYAGDRASDQENYSKLLKMMQIRSPQNRKAKFVCNLIAFSPKGDQFQFDGELTGLITTSPKGTMGFGYDPVFCPDGSTQTLAEITPGQKNAISHRFKAAHKFADFIKTQL